MTSDLPIDRTTVRELRAGIGSGDHAFIRGYAAPFPWGEITGGRKEGNFASLLMKVGALLTDAMKRSPRFDADEASIALMDRACEAGRVDVYEVVMLGVATTQSQSPV